MQHPLEIDFTRWNISIPKSKKTLQFFITDLCNKKCKGCFYEDYINKDKNPFMDFDFYKSQINKFSKYFEKVILMGGEPTLHPQLEDFVLYNKDNGLSTTIYTNGTKLDKLSSNIYDNSNIRVGILGYSGHEKNLCEIPKVDYPITIVLMIRKNNKNDLTLIAEKSEEFNCKSLYLSTIRDIRDTKDFWKDNDETITNEEYKFLIEDFLDSYNGKIKKIEIARRGVIDNLKWEDDITSCRFLNVHMDGTFTICPFDISLLKKEDPDIMINGRTCQKNNGSCILQKFILTRS